MVGSFRPVARAISAPSTLGTSESRWVLAPTARPSDLIDAKSLRVGLEI